MIIIISNIVIIVTTFAASPFRPRAVFKAVQRGHVRTRGSQDSSKGGAVETGCSDLYGIIC